MHGGRVWVAWSEVGKGSAFRVWLPSGKDHLDPRKVQDEAGLTGVGVARGVSEQYIQEAMGWIGEDVGMEDTKASASGGGPKGGERDGVKESRIPLPVTWSATGAGADGGISKPYIL